METLYSKNFYKSGSHLDNDRRVIDFEKELADSLPFSQESLGCSNEQWSKLVAVFAKRVADSNTKRLLEEKKTYLAVRKNLSSLGYTSKTQEIREAHNITTAFEYNCFKLAEFKNKYGIVQ